MATVLVTGGSGFVGANLVARLVHDGHAVHLLLRPGYRAWRLTRLLGDVQRHEAVLADAISVSAVVKAVRPDWVFHLAVHGAYPQQTDWPQMIATNIQGTFHLVEACRAVGFAAFVNTGSSSEYGYKTVPPTEQEWLEPNSHYAVTKAAGTLFCRHTAQRYGLRMPTLRLYSAYGPYEEPTRLMPRLVVQGRRGQFPPLVAPEIARDYVAVEDVVRAYLLAATVPDQEYGAVYNVGTGTQTTLRDVVATAQEVLRIPGEPVWGSMPNRQWDTNAWVADQRQIRAALGWQPEIAFRDGFRRLAEWYEAEPSVHGIYEANELG